MKFFIFVLPCFLMACATGGESEQELSHRKMRMMSTKIKTQEKQIERLKAKNVVLNGREARFGRKKQSISQRARVDLSKLTEKQAYKSIATYYKQNNEPMIRSAAMSFKKSFPKSEYIDNIYYMIGSLKLKNKDYVKSIKYFDQVAKKYPQQDKAPFAIYAKGLVYKKLGLNEQAMSAFESVAKRYPRSKAATKAMREIKTIQ